MAELKNDWRVTPKIWFTSKGDKVVEIGVIKSKKIRNCIDYQAICESFIEKCLDEQLPLTIARLCLFLNIDEKEFDELCAYRPKKSVEDQWTYRAYRSELMRRMRTEIEANLLEEGLRNRTNATIVTLALKNKHSWKEKVEQVTQVEFDPRTVYQLLNEAKERDGEKVEYIDDSEDDD